MLRMLTLCFFAVWQYSPIVALADALKVVTTLSTYADIARSIGGDLIDVSYVASPRFNPHFIEPRPSDVLKLKRCDLFIHGGLDLEVWKEPLVNAAARPELRTGGSRELDLSLGVELLEVPSGTLSRAQGDIHLFGNPHYWLDPRNVLKMAQAITRKLSEVDSASADRYKENLGQFLTRLNSKIAEWQQRLALFKGQELVGYHNEWIYLMNFAGLKMEQYLEPKPGIPPGPRHLEFLSSYIRERKIRAIVQATFYPTEASEGLSERSGAQIATLCQNVGEVPEASDYISMLNFNIAKLAGVLGDA